MAIRIGMRSPTWGTRPEVILEGHMCDVTVVFSFMDSAIPSCFLSLCVVSLFPQHFVHDLSAVLRDPSSFALFQLFFPALPRISLS